MAFELTVFMFDYWIARVAEHSVEYRVELGQLCNGPAW